MIRYIGEETNGNVRELVSHLFFEFFFVLVRGVVSFFFFFGFVMNEKRSLQGVSQPC